MTGLSMSQCMRYLKSLEEDKWISYNNKDLHLSPFKQFFIKKDGYNRRTITITKEDSIKDISIKLEEKLLEENLIKQSTAIKFKSKAERQLKDYNKLNGINKDKSGIKSKKDLDRFKKLDLQFNSSTITNIEVEEETKDLNLSLNKAAQILNCSKSRVSNFYQKSKNLEQVYRFKFMMYMTYPEFKEFRKHQENPYIFKWQSGMLLRQLSSRIVMKEYNKSITYHNSKQIYYLKKGINLNDAIYKYNALIGQSPDQYMDIFNSKYSNPLLGGYPLSNNLVLVNEGSLYEKNEHLTTEDKKQLEEFISDFETNW